VHIQRKAAKGKPLSGCQKGRNTQIAKTRARVTHVFASLEQIGGEGLRCIGMERATRQLNFKAATYNLRRLCSLETCEIPPLLPCSRQSASGIVKKGGFRLKMAEKRAILAQ